MAQVDLLLGNMPGIGLFLRDARNPGSLQKHMITTRGPMNSSIQLPDHSAALGSNAKEKPASPNSALVPWHLVFSLHFFFPCPIYQSIGLLVFIRQVPANRVF